MGNRLLLVEGKNDMHVMKALFSAHDVPDCFDVEYPNVEDEIGGISALLESIPVRLKQSGLKRLGIVVDADEDLDNRWREVRSVLTGNSSVSIPPHPLPEGTSFNIPDGPRVGVWVMPNSKVPGILESFLTFLAPAEDKLFLHVERFIQETPPDASRCPVRRLPQAKIHTWLAVQEEPGKPLGLGITAKYLDAHAEVVNPFIAWIRSTLVD